ncbi:MAG: DUF309 domain-containing protein [Planctomycetota bacterium]|nr:DUF309 domain-containing protein [Planctomycetota bacterium]
MSENAGTLRYAPERAFPPYAYLPGRDPHPTGDPRGHSYTGTREPPAPYFAAAHWSDNADYLFGADLYNHGFFWEAHEVWEGLWHSAKHDPRQADFLQSLIQCSAACLKIPMQQPAGLEKLSTNALTRLERISRETKGSYMGLDLADFVPRFRSFASSRPASPDERPRLVLG